MTSSTIAVGPAGGPVPAGWPEFLQLAYEASADLGGWDRRALEPAEQPPRHPTRAWSVGS